METESPIGLAERDGAPREVPVVGLPAAQLAGAELRAWRAFLRAHAVVMRHLETELTDDGGMSLARYDVLVQLAYADGRQLRMHELAERVLLSRSGITRVVDRLVADGLVERRACPSDARGSFAALTSEGLGRLRAATPVHLAGVRRHFLEQVTDADLDTLATLLERVASACVESVAAAPETAPIVPGAAPIAAADRDARGLMAASTVQRPDPVASVSSD